MSLVAMEVIAFYGKSLLAMQSHRLPWIGTGCYGKPLFAIAIQLSLCKPLIDMESQCFL
jgi:hypothetical protein